VISTRKCRRASLPARSRGGAMDQTVVGNKKMMNAVQRVAALLADSFNVF
jgi:hypothetical protein